jgi:hypothetical protein
MYMPKKLYWYIYCKPHRNLPNSNYNWLIANATGACILTAASWQ